MITICDFDDSFTFNLYSDLSIFTQKIEILNYKKDFLKLNEIAETSSPSILILGPGPGHPNEYEEFNSLIDKALSNNSLMLVGVCLGHQLILQYMGASCVPSSNIVHGQQVELLDFSKFLKIKMINKILAQRYNSFTVEFDSNRVEELEELGWSFYCLDGELLASFAKDVLTYQFHPESIGTTSKNQIYSPIEEFLLKYSDEF